MKGLLLFVERIDQNRVRQLCIEYNLFTRGNNEEYSSMLQKCEGNPRQVIQEVVPIILQHSETDMTEVNLASALYNCCCFRWVEEVKGEAMAERRLYLYFKLSLDSYNQPDGNVEKVWLTKKRFLELRNKGAWIFEDYGMALRAAQR